MTQGREKFQFRHIPSLIKNTYSALNEDGPFRLSAAVAYYAVLSLPALLVIIVNVTGTVIGADSMENLMASEFGDALGKDAAESVRTMLSESRQNDKNLISSIIGLGTLVFGATGMFYQLQLALNEIWRVEPKPDAKWWKLAIDRARSFAFILVIGFLLLISFVITAGLSAFSDFISRSFSESLIPIAHVFDTVSSLAIITVLFALIFKYLPDATIKWKTVWVGALITSVLFLVGKLLLGFYFGKTDPGSTYGAAGTIVLILLWVSYSCLILFFGAKFTYIYAEKYGDGVEPMPIAQKTEK